MEMRTLSAARLAKNGVIRQVLVDHQVVLAYLFGSQAEGKARRSSDVDLAVLFKPSIPREQWFNLNISLVGALCDALSRNDVDVLILNKATPTLRYQVVKHGRVIYEDSLTKPAVDFASQTYLQYADTAHFRRLSRRYLEEWIDARNSSRQSNNRSPGTS